MMKNRFDRVYIEITNICNFNCPFCSSAGHDKKEMTVGEFEKVANEIKDYTQEVCLHVLGEPLLHSHFEEIIKICKINNLKIYLVTNGYFLHEKLEILLEYIKVFSKINISLHSFLFQPLKRKQKFTEILEATKILAENGEVIELRNLSSNKDDAFEKDLSESMNGVLQEHIKDFSKNQKLQEKLYYVVKKPFDWPDKTTDASEEKSKSKRIYCLGGRTHIAILSNMDVVPCCLDSSAKLLLGNLKNENLQTILSSVCFQKLYTSFGCGKANEKFCQTCNYNKAIKD